MEQTRGILCLKDPLDADRSSQMQTEDKHSMTLIFDENGRYLSLAQTALWRMRRKHEWMCVAAEGSAACIGLALAAQLPVDRLALIGSSMFVRTQNRLPRELMRLQTYARRNMPLVISEILLIGVQEAEVRGILRGLGRGRICALEDAENRENSRNTLIAPWPELCRKNLLIQ